MAKSNGNSLAKSNDQGLLAKNGPAVTDGAMIEGDEGANAQLGRLAMYYDTKEEKVKYAGCGFAEGDLIDVLEKRKVASKKIVPIGGYITYVKWPDGAKQPEYVLKNKAEVPPGDLEWDNGTPPIATRCVNAIVLVEGEPWPYLFTFKKTSHKVGETIFQLEARRGMAKRGRGCYEIGHTDGKNADGDSYTQITYRPAGDCPASLSDLLARCVTGYAAVKAKAEDVEQTVADESDNVPI